jgi:adenine-specific DNA-methyltransferase
LIFKRLEDAIEAHQNGEEFVIFNGRCEKLLLALKDQSVELVFTSPPYFMGKAYDRSYKIEDFYSDHRAISPSIARIIKQNGNVCWQVGNHVSAGSILPLDFAVYEVFKEHPSLILRNRIIWHFGHGTHAKKRFSGRHETMLWYGKGKSSYFSLDDVRVPQKYPGKRHYKGPKKGDFSGNPLGKNPSDVWEIPNVNANHVEKTSHPCQFPIALAQRVIRALSPIGSLVVDPFMGSGSAGIAAILEGRNFLGSDTSMQYCRIAQTRYEKLKAGKLSIRPLNRAIWQPNMKDSVAKTPTHFSNFQ